MILPVSRCKLQTRALNNTSLSSCEWYMVAQISIFFVISIRPHLWSVGIFLSGFSGCSDGSNSDTWVLADNSRWWQRPKCAIHEELWMSSERQHLVSVLTYVRWEEVVQSRTGCNSLIAPTPVMVVAAWVLQTLFKGLTFIENLFWAHHGSKLYGPTTQARQWDSCPAQLCSGSVSMGAVTPLLTLKTMRLSQWHIQSFDWQFALMSICCSEHYESKSTVSMPGH